MPTLLYRRERADIVQVFKVMKKFDEVHLISLHTNSSGKTRGHEEKIVKRHYRYKNTLNSYVARIANPWNSLPKACINSENVNSFKTNINNAWKHKDSKFKYNF